MFCRTNCEVVKRSADVNELWSWVGQLAAVPEILSSFFGCFFLSENVMRRHQTSRRQSKVWSFFLLLLFFLIQIILSVRAGCGLRSHFIVILWTLPHFFCTFSFFTHQHFYPSAFCASVWVCVCTGHCWSKERVPFKVLCVCGRGGMLFHTRPMGNSFSFGCRPICISCHPPFSPFFLPLSHRLRNRTVERGRERARERERDGEGSSKLKRESVGEKEEEEKKRLSPKLPPASGAPQATQDSGTEWHTSLTAKVPSSHRLLVFNSIPLKKKRLKERKREKDRRKKWDTSQRYRRWNRFRQSRDGRKCVAQRDEDAKEPKKRVNFSKSFFDKK